MSSSVGDRGSYEGLVTLITGGGAGSGPRPRGCWPAGAGGSRSWGARRRRSSARRPRRRRPAASRWRSRATWSAPTTWSGRSGVTVERFGRLDALVANAGVQLHADERAIHEEDEAVWERTQEVNSRGVFLTCRAGIRQMLEQGDGGAVVITSSITALVGTNGHNPAYTASKGAVLSLGRALAVYYAPQGIRVNVVCPGALSEPPDVERLEDPAARERRVVPNIPLGRLGQLRRDRADGGVPVRTRVELRDRRGVHGRRRPDRALARAGAEHPAVGGGAGEEGGCADEDQGAVDQ